VTGGCSDQGVTKIQGSELQNVQGLGFQECRDKGSMSVRGSGCQEGAGIR
jgi:hypothetical protein